MIRKTAYVILLAGLLLWASGSLLTWRTVPEVPSPSRGITLGVLAPFSGPLAEYGQAIRNGIELAKERHPQHLSGLNVIYEDSKYEAKTAVSAFQQLVSSGADIVYNFGGPTSEAIAPIAEAQKVPLLVWSADPAVARQRRYVIRFINSALDFGSTLNKHLKAKGYKTIAIVKTENQYIDSMLDALRSSLDSSQQLEVIDSYPTSAMDFRTTVAKLRAKPYDAVGVYLQSGQVAQLYKQFRLQGLTQPTFGTDFLESTSEVAEAGSAIHGAVFPNHAVSNTFLKDYLERFKNDYQLPNAGLSYDLAHLLYESFCSPKTETAVVDVLEILQKTKSFQGVSGTFNFKRGVGGDQHFAVPIELRQVTDSGEITSLALSSHEEEK